MDVVRSGSAGVPVVWVGSADDDPGLTEALAAEVSRHGGSAAVDIEVLVGSFDPPGARLLDLVAVMDHLRTECPWDRRQNHDSLIPYLVEECYEAIDAVMSGDAEHLRDELGDVLLQVVFHARVAAEHEGDPFDIDDVAGAIVAKLVRRHPHVFGGVEVDGPEQVSANWDAIKAQERRETLARTGQAPRPAGPTAELARLVTVLVEATERGVDARPVVIDAIERVGHLSRTPLN